MVSAFNVHTAVFFRLRSLCLFNIRKFIDVAATPGIRWSQPSIFTLLCFSRHFGILVPLHDTDP